MESTLRRFEKAMVEFPGTPEFAIVSQRQTCAGRASQGQRSGRDLRLMEDVRKLRSNEPAHRMDFPNVLGKSWCRSQPPPQVVCRPNPDERYPLKKYMNEFVWDDAKFPKKRRPAGVCIASLKRRECSAPTGYLPLVLNRRRKAGTYSST